MFIYGPVPSRRLGRSLGVSLIPAKTCTYSCVYCQLGRTNRLQSRRESFFPKERVLSEIRKQLSISEADFISLVGDGEPTLSLDIGWLIQKCKENTDRPIAVITNGSILFRPDVRDELMAADVVIPSLDAGSEEVFRAVNRPHGNIEYDRMLQGQVDFRREYKGQIWLEVMLVHGVNDTEAALKEIRSAAGQIMPDRLYITTPIRPPAEPWVEPPPPDEIIRAQQILGQSFTIDERESGGFGLDSFSGARQAILEIGSRHPLRLEQALEIENEFAESGTVEMMLKEKKLVKISYSAIEYLLPDYFVRNR